jgi:arabinan endo-1,5-alpha-L-arabinosidase
MTTTLRLAAAAALFFLAPVFALDGQPGIHDPSTVIVHDGKYYTYGTGAGLPALMSDDGWTWRRAGSLRDATPGGFPGPETIARGGNNSWAPDVIRVGDNYFVYYSAPGTQPKAAIGLLVGKTLDPSSPDYKFVDAGPVVWSDGVEDSNSIDPGVLRDAAGRLWLTYGSYFGYIRLVELDPKTGKRLYPNRQPVNIAINSEASIMIQRDGWYYLLVTHGSCCQGANSTYNIRMGRSRQATGPFLDNMGVDMLQGGGKLFLGSGGRLIGPGHFGLLDLGGGVQKFSMHFEADLDRGGISVLDIRPLLWRDGWPVAGENFKEGTYQIESARTGTALEMAVQGMPVGGPRGRGARGGGFGGGAGRAAGPGGRGAGPAAGPGPGPGPGAPAAPQAPPTMQRPLHQRPRSLRRKPRRSRPTGRLVPLTCGWHPTWCRRSRSGALRPWRMPAAIRDRPTSRSPSTAPSARWQPRRPVNCRPSPPLPAHPNNSGASTNWSTARIA